MPESEADAAPSPLDCRSPPTWAPLGRRTNRTHERVQDDPWAQAAAGPPQRHGELKHSRTLSQLGMRSRGSPGIAMSSRRFAQSRLSMFLLSTPPHTVSFVVFGWEVSKIKDEISRFVEIAFLIWVGWGREARE